MHLKGGRSWQDIVNYMNNDVFTGKDDGRSFQINEKDEKAYITFNYSDASYHFVYDEKNKVVTIDTPDGTQGSVTNKAGDKEKPESGLIAGLFKKSGNDKNDDELIFKSNPAVKALAGNRTVQEHTAASPIEQAVGNSLNNAVSGGLVGSIEQIAVKAVAGSRTMAGVLVKELRPITKLIKTGTSGWRDEHEGEFNIDNIRRMAEGHARYYDSQVTETDINKKPYMIIGYDPRQDNVRNVKETARIFAAHNIPVKIIVAEPTPTPVLAYLANSGLLEPGREVFGTVNFTASHNPGKYNGYKPGAGDGGLADDDVANEIARLANEAEDYRSMDYEEAKEQGLITEIDPEDAVTIYTNYVIGKLKANGMWEKIAERIKGDPTLLVAVGTLS
jgi:hypothetical protein